MKYLMFPVQYIREQSLEANHERYTVASLTVMMSPKFKVVDVIDGEELNPNECLTTPKLNPCT